MAAEPGITELLRAWRGGDPAAEAKLFAAMYDELRRRAGRQLRGERSDHTLLPTALVHEAYVRLSEGADLPWQDRAHFLAVASRIMRRVLVDHARARLAAKRPDGKLRVTLDGLAADEQAGCDILDLNAALDELEQLEPRLSQIAMLRYMGGLSVDEIADVLEVSRNTVKRDWTVAKAWLYRRLSPAAG
jgi:RNA polymerase sigma factor (TIGR02999 family)